jgi:hypothetical protein
MKKAGLLAIAAFTAAFGAYAAVKSLAEAIEDFDWDEEEDLSNI